MEDAAIAGATPDLSVCSAGADPGGVVWVVTVGVSPSLVNTRLFLKGRR
jgi:hypothetical protein